MKKWLPWLPFMALLVAGAIAWGQNDKAIDNLERRVTRSEELQTQVNALAAGQARIEERTKLMLEEQRNLRRLVESALRLRRQQMP